MEKILKQVKNYFYKFYEMGNFSIEQNKIKIKGKYLTGQYIRIENSSMNDGVYKVAYAKDGEITLQGFDLIDEEFEGVISSLAIPKQLINLLPKIEKYEEENKQSPIVSESFGTYSYTLATDTTGKAIGWEKVFASELKRWNKMYDNKRGVKRVK